MRIEIELNADDLSVLRSYFCHRNGYIPLELFFMKVDKIDWEMVRQCERLAQKLIDTPVTFREILLRVP